MPLLFPKLKPSLLMVQEKQGKLLSPGKKGTSGNIFFPEGTLLPKGWEFQGISGTILALQHWPKVPLNLVCDSGYTVYTLLHIDQALLKGSVEPQFLRLFLTLQSLLGKRKHPLFATHIRSHSGLSGPMAEGNSRAIVVERAHQTFKTLLNKQKRGSQKTSPRNLTMLAIYSYNFLNCDDHLKSPIDKHLKQNRPAVPHPLV